MGGAAIASSLCSLGECWGEVSLDEQLKGPNDRVKQWGGRKGTDSWMKGTARHSFISSTKLPGTMVLDSVRIT